MSRASFMETLWGISQDTHSFAQQWNAASAMDEFFCFGKAGTNDLLGNTYSGKDYGIAGEARCNYLCFALKLNEGKGEKFHSAIKVWMHSFHKMKYSYDEPNKTYLQVNILYSMHWVFFRKYMQTNNYYFFGQKLAFHELTFLFLSTLAGWIVYHNQDSKKY